MKWGLVSFLHSGDAHAHGSNTSVHEEVGHMDEEGEHHEDGEVHEEGHVE